MKEEVNWWLDTIPRSLNSMNKPLADFIINIDANESGSGWGTKDSDLHQIIAVNYAKTDYRKI